jgi:rhodanese-related sulfurtransferase
MFIEIRRKDVKTLVAQGRAQLVDVRPASDYEKEHLPHAVSLPLERMTPGAARILRKDQAVIVYSSDAQCDLSARAAGVLESIGFYEVYRYAPGKADWLAAGLATEGAEEKKVRLRHMIHKDVPTCRLRERLQDVKSRRRPNQDTCVVVNESNIVLGVIHKDAWEADPDARIGDIMDPAPQTIRPDLEPKDAQKILRGYQAATVLVTTSDGELLGALRIAQKKAQKPLSAA